MMLQFLIVIGIVLIKQPLQERLENRLVDLLDVSTLSLFNLSPC